MSKISLILLLLLLSILPINAQDDEYTPIPIDELEYNNIETINNLLDNMIDTLDRQYAVISPDGRYIAWFYNSEDQICVYSLNANTENSLNCTSIPEGQFVLPPSALLWSPNSRYVAFVQGNRQALREPDIWLYDLNDSSIRNFTDDNVTGRIPFGLDSEEKANVDLSFAWSSDNDLYVYRYVLDEERDINDSEIGIHRISPETNISTQVADLTDLFSPHSVTFSEIVYLDGTMSVSPNGRYIALSVFQSFRARDEANGVWIIDLMDDGEARQVMTSDDLAQGAPDYYFTEDDLGLYVSMSVAWANDNQSLFVMSENSGIRNSAVASHLLFNVDIESGEVTAFNDLAERMLFTDDVTARNFPAYHVIPAPNRDGLLVMLWELPLGAQLWSLQITEAGIVETLLFADARFSWSGTYSMPSVAYDGTTLLGGSIFRLNPEF